MPGSRRGSITIGLIVVAILVVGLILIVGGAFAYWKRMDAKVDEVRTHGLPPATSGGFLERAWELPRDLRARDLVVRFNPLGEAVELLALSGSEIERIDMAGRRFAGIPAPDRPSRIFVDEAGRFPLILVASNKVRRETLFIKVPTDYYLTALGVDGATKWVYHLPAAEVSILDARVADLDADGDPEILLSTGKRIVRLDGSGKELPSPAPVKPIRTFAAADLNGDGRLELLVNWVADKVESIRDGNGQPWGEQRILEWIRVESMAAGEPPGVAIVGPTRGHATSTLTLQNAAADPVFSHQLPRDVRPVVYRQVFAIDTDGDGRKAWVLGASDGGFYLFSADGSNSAIHHTGQHLYGFAIFRASGGDLIVAMTHRGLSAWRLAKGSRSPVD